LHLEGPLHAQYGWVVDFDHVMAQAETVRAQLDHRLLNEIPGLENPTAELIGRWIYDGLADALPELVGVSLHETSDSCARYRGR
jgi:6-pyruvoyltetrahydropterin/6-carboxytetrahydropterin synthase